MRAVPVLLSVLSLGLSALPLAAVAQEAAPVAAEAPAEDYVTAAIPTAPVPPVAASDRFLGREDAPVTVIQYASFTCSHCAGWHKEILPEFKSRFIDTGQVRLVYRDLPTEPVQVAAIAAGIARCAAPARYFDVADSLMQGQAKLGEDGLVQPWLDAAITASGKTRPEIEACLADPATLAGLQASRSDALAAGVLGTPTFFVEGVLVQGYGMDMLAPEIERRLALMR